VSNVQSKISEEEFKKLYPKLCEAIFGDGKSLSDQLLISSLYLMAFECLKDFIEDNFQSFFSAGMTLQGRKIIYTPSKEYASTRAKFVEQYRLLAKNLLGVETKRVGTFHAACAWFYEMQAFNDDDIKLIIGALHLRNNFAHELYRWIVDDALPHLDRDFIKGPINLYFKISNWWIRNFEAGIVPEDYEQLSDEEMRGAMAMNVQLLQLMVDKALPEKL
jgi:hypothetical protein